MKPHKHVFFTFKKLFCVPTIIIMPHQTVLSIQNLEDFNNE